MVDVDDDRDRAIPRLPQLTRSIAIDTTSPEFIRELLKPPNRLPFKKIVWRRTITGKFEGVADLVEKCSLESIEIDFGTSVESYPSTLATSSISICRRPDRLVESNKPQRSRISVLCALCINHCEHMGWWAALGGPRLCSCPTLGVA